MATAAQWLAGARPRTLPAAIAPVAVGTGLAASLSAAMPTRALLCLVVAVALQVGVNYANDYSDGIRGTDRTRVGPVRLVGQGLAGPAAVRRAAWLSFAVAAGAGLLLVALVGEPWLLIVGAGCIAAAWFYTGGKHPYGYLGLGEVFVFIFFGLVPVVGTCYVQAHQVPITAVFLGAAIGAIACAVLVANNLRDIPTDTQTGKRTLAVRLGDRSTRMLYLALFIGSAVAVALTAVMSSAVVALALIAYAIAIRPVRAVLTGAQGPALIRVLKDTGVVLLVVGLSLAVLLAVR